LLLGVTRRFNAIWTASFLWHILNVLGGAVAKKKTVIKKKVPFPKEVFILVGLFAAGAVISKFDLFGTGPGVGQRAPEIVGMLQDGSTAKLSYYKRKVVLLDFSGDW
jgi:hypothetical protein